MQSILLPPLWAQGFSLFRRRTGRCGCALLRPRWDHSYGISTRSLWLTLLLVHFPSPVLHEARPKERLTNVFAVFQALVKDILWDLINGLTFWSFMRPDHIQNVQLVLQHLHKNQFFVKAETCEFHVSSVTSVTLVCQQGQLSSLLLSGPLHPLKNRSSSSWALQTITMASSGTTAQFSWRLQKSWPGVGTSFHSFYSWTELEDSGMQQLNNYFYFWWVCSGFAT